MSFNLYLQIFWTHNITITIIYSQSVLMSLYALMREEDETKEEEEEHEWFEEEE